MPKKLETDVEQSSLSAEVDKNLKVIKNRGNQRIELFIGDETVVLMPGDSVDVPKEFVIPPGIGVFEKL